MRIAYIAAGAAGMYCGSCLNDNALARALIDLGQDVTLIPTYTPLRTDEDDVSIDRVFYGAVAVYLAQQSALFRRMPRLLERALASRRLLDWAAAQGGSPDARRLGALTLSTLRGEQGHQRRELERLVQWLAEGPRPDVVHLSNSMLLGMARRIRSELRVPLLCSLQGEDLFLDRIGPPHHDAVIATLREKAQDADGFVATSRFYVEVMQRYLEVPADRIHAVRLGIRLDGFGPPERPPAPTPFVVGYFARISPEKGLHVLAEAFRELSRRAAPGEVRLRIAGYLAARERGYLEGIMGRMREWGLEGVVEHAGELSRPQKVDFLRSLHVLSVPTTYREPKGRSVLEALACGVPVVEPAHGAFPEMVETTGGGVLVEPGSVPALVEALDGLRRDPARRSALGARGLEGVRRHYGAQHMATAMLDVYRRYVGVPARAAAAPA